MPLPVDSEWVITRESAPQHVIKITASDATTFSAIYLDIDNPSKFTGEVRTRDFTVMSLRQRADETNYSAFHVGARRGSLDEYVGSWWDVAHGFSGTFKLALRSGVAQETVPGER
jgi:hypothetical protein